MFLFIGLITTFTTMIGSIHIRGIHNFDQKGSIHNIIHLGIMDNCNIPYRNDTLEKYFLYEQPTLNLNHEITTLKKKCQDLSLNHNRLKKDMQNLEKNNSKIEQSIKKLQKNTNKTQTPKKNNKRKRDNDSDNDDDSYHDDEGQEREKKRKRGNKKKEVKRIKDNLGSTLNFKTYYEKNTGTKKPRKK